MHSWLKAVWAPVWRRVNAGSVSGKPYPARISISFVERQNLTMRASMRRFTRLTNAFSKKIENHEVAVAPYFIWYNFGRVHQTLRVTPAMEAGVADNVWTVAEIVALLDWPPTATSVQRSRLGWARGWVYAGTRRRGCP